MANKKQHSGEAGYIAERTNPYVPGTKVVIYNAEEQGIDASDKYVVVCDAHSGMVSMASVPEARLLMKQPDKFCDGCRAVQKSKALAANYGSAPAKCQVCGKKYDVADLVRSQGNVLWKYQYCSAQCYTEAYMKRVGESQNTTALKRAQQKLHTPGDWKVKWQEQKGYVDGGVWIITDSRGHMLFEAVQKGRHLKTKQNAHVAAASPKLLRACALMQADLNSDGLIRQETRVAIREALTIAVGMGD